jgi:hypothetical protein
MKGEVVAKENQKRRVKSKKETTRGINLIEKKNYYNLIR